MGIFARIKKAWYDSIIWETIDEDFYDELEESLIMADLGAAVAADAVKELRKVVYEKSIQRGDDVKQALRDILEKKLEVGDTNLDLSTTPSVVLIIGVNGVGKTTSIGKLASRYKKQGKRVLLCAADTLLTEKALLWRRRIPSARRRRTSSKFGQTARAWRSCAAARVPIPARCCSTPCRRRRREMWTLCSAIRRAACTTRRT